MSNNKGQARNFSDLDPQEARAALAEALDAEIEPGDGDEAGEQDAVEPEVVRMPVDDADDTEIDLFGDAENPFQAAAEFARQVRMVEALLFASADPMDEAALKKRLPEDSDIKEILSALQQQYENRGINLRKSGRKWQFMTAPNVSHILEIEQVQPRKLSRAALETLAIIAYHQPCTRADIEEVRGVAVSKGSLDQLMEIGWVGLRGRREDVPGRPLLYGTSQEFLEHFGLQSVGHLPGLADLKAAGLLDARLPPGFTVPSPKDGHAVADADEDGAQDFVQDFHEQAEGDDADFDAAMAEPDATSADDDAELAEAPEISDDFEVEDDLTS